MCAVPPSNIHFIKYIYCIIILILNCSSPPLHAQSPLLSPLLFLTLVTGGCRSTASLYIWRSPVRHPRRCQWPEGWLAPSPRWRLRWSRTMKTQIWTLEEDTGNTGNRGNRGTWAVKQHYKEKNEDFKFFWNFEQCGMWRILSQLYSSSHVAKTKVHSTYGDKCGSYITSRCISGSYNVVMRKGKD